MQLLVATISVDPGGSQPPFWHTQPVPGCTVVQLEVLLVVDPEVGGSQLPLTHVHPDAG